jgi:hypothetical protein
MASLHNNGKHARERKNKADMQAALSFRPRFRL